MYFKYDRETKQQSTLWTFHNEDKPTKVMEDWENVDFFYKKFVV